MESSSLIGLNWSTLRRRAKEYAAEHGASSLDQATEWYLHPSWETRYFAVIVLGELAGNLPRALSYLYDHCGEDPAWQVNEALAMAFDAYCAAVGYEQAVPEMERWLTAPRPNLRRAVSEGLRPWTAKNRAYFAANPCAAVRLIGLLKDDESRYVQESAGNPLRDISRNDFDLVLETARGWVDDKPERKSRRLIAKFALKNAVRSDPALKRLYE